MIQEALTYIFNLIFNDIINPIRRSLIESQLVNNLVPRINNILSGVFNLFREVPTDKYDNILNNNAIAEFGGLIIAIFFIILFVKILTFGFGLMGDIMQTMLLSNKEIKGTKEWRKQWKRGK